MRRVIEPLERMGARIASNNDRPPLTVTGTVSTASSTPWRCPAPRSKAPCCSPVCRREGRTRVIEPAATRNHTELALRAFGATVVGQWLGRRDRRRPALDRAQTWWCRAISHPRRSGLSQRPRFRVRSWRFWMWAQSRRERRSSTFWRAPVPRLSGRFEAEEGGEPRGTVHIRSWGHATPRDRPGRSSGADRRAACAGSTRHVWRRTPRHRSAELRVKESDRISALVTGLRALGGDVDEIARRVSRARLEAAPWRTCGRGTRSPPCHGVSPLPRLAPSDRP